jgi:SpoVK/Ycf46/Vps4 family AAA+-type ATPase
MKNVIKSDHACTTIKDLENELSIYAGYRESLRYFLVLLGLTVHTPRRETIRAFLCLISLRLHELRCSLRRSLGASFNKSFSGVLQRLHTSPDSVQIRTGDLKTKLQDRLLHLLCCFRVEDSSRASESESPTADSRDVDLDGKSFQPRSQRRSIVGWNCAPIRSIPNVPSMLVNLTREQAVTRISSTFRMLKAQRQYILSRELELETLGMVPPLDDPLIIEQSQKFKRARQEKAERYREDWVRMEGILEDEIRSKANDSLISGFAAETLKAIWDFRETNKSFPESIESFLNPPPVNSKDKKKPGQKPVEKKRPVAAEPISTSSNLSTIEELEKFIGTFDWNKEWPVFTEENCLKIHEKVKQEIIRDMNKQLEGWKKSDPLLTEDPPSSGQIQPQSVSEYDEQDTIDLIKSGILVKSSSTGLDDVFANVFATSGLASIKSDLLETLIFPLAIPLVWERGTRVRSVFIEGSSGCGKTLFAHSIAHESGACMYVLPKTLTVEQLELVTKVAVHHAPSVVLIENLEDFTNPAPVKLKKKAATTEPKIFDAVIERLNGLKDSRILLIACSQKAPTEEIKGKFSYHVLIDPLCEDDRYEIIKGTLKRLGAPVRYIRMNLVPIRAIARLCEGISSGAIISMLENVFSRRSFDLHVLETEPFEKYLTNLSQKA